MALLDRIKYEGPPDILVWKYDKENIVLGSQLIVDESQEALFYKEGQALDVFTPGRYTLSSKNLPILQKLINLPFGGKTPFSAEIFYVNRTARLDYKWGTSKPIPIEDPVYKVLLSIGCHGQFGLRVEDSLKFVKNIVGTLQTARPEQTTHTRQTDGTMSAWDGSKVLDYFRGLIINQVKNTVAEFVVKRDISVSTITAYIEEISKLIEVRCKEEFANYGISLLRFFVTSITIPDAELKKIQEGAFERLKIEQIGDERYRAKRTFDTLEKAAANEAAAGTLMSAGVGLGMGAKMAGGLSGLADDALAGKPQQQDLGDAIKCSKCGRSMPSASRFCPDCGTAAGPPQIACPHCEQSIPTNAKFCPLCGKSLIATCSKCGQDIPGGSKFCPHCGQSADSPNDDEQD